MSKSVKFAIDLQVNGKNVIGEVAVKARDLASGLAEAQTKGGKLFETLLKFNQVTRSFQDVFHGLQQLTGAMHSYTQAYTAQQQAETQLATAMRNTMNATNEQIDSIKNLTAAQQELGVVGDEVQLAGAQVLATHLKHTETLRLLIPAMNDLAVAQNGVNVTSENAASVAALLGKAMEGNVNALKRMGISFTDAQKQIMETGSESQRAAVLVDVLSARFGGMNESLANTAAGGLQQASNSFGDMKERIGALFIQFEPTLQKAGELGLAFMALGQTCAALRASFTAVKTVILSVRSAEIVATATAAIHTQTLRVLSAVMRATGVSANVLRLAIRSLMIATGVGAAIVALTFIIEKLAGAADKGASAERDLADATGSLKEAEEAGTQAAAAARAEMDREIAKLGDLIKSKADTRAAVQELNNKYGEWFGMCSTAQQWYDALIKSSDAYCQQLAYEAQMRVYYEKKAQLEIERERIRSQQRELIESGKDTAGRPMGGFSGLRGAGQTDYVASKEMLELNARENTLTDQINEEQKNIDTTKGLMGDLKPAGAALPKTTPKTGTVRPSSTGGANTGGGETFLAGQLGWYDQQISELNKKRLHLSDPEDIRNLDEQIQKLKDARTLIESMTQFTADERNRFGALSAAGTSATSQVGGGSMVPEMSSQDDILKSVGFSWDDVTSKADEYFTLLKQQDAAAALERGQTAIDNQRKKFQGATDAVSQFGGAFASLGNALKVPELNAAGTLAQAIATMTAGYATATAQSSTLGPWAWVAFAATGLAQLAAMISQVKNMNAFADGALAFGPTVGLFGEYAGARNNPEVVAPLDRLRSYISDAGGGRQEVTVRIKERDLVGMSRKSNRYRGRM